MVWHHLFPGTTTGYDAPHVGPLAGAADFVAEYTGDPDFDTIGDSISVVATNRANKVSQDFQKKLSAIDYQIQRQDLHRQDIRDLYEVTTSRMDTFFLSGTFLLAFCLQWFTGSQIFSGGMPSWFVNLFIITNFNAVGYLLFSIWFAMHASIVAHSLGARLLLNYQRLSIPTNKQLDRIYVPFYPQPKTHKLVELGRKLGFIPKEEDMEDEEPFSHDENTQHSYPGDPRGVSDLHLRRFWQAQSQWLVYDAYARVCVILGMNMLMHALSYYVVAEIDAWRDPSAICVFLGVKTLAMIVLRLDFSDDFLWYEKYVAIATTVGPSFIASCLLYLPIPDSPYKSLWATLCFLFHYGFNVLIRYDIEPVKPSDGETLVRFPRVFRTLGYLKISELKQRRIAEALRRSLRRVSTVKQANDVEVLRTSLEARMKEVMRNEEETGDVSSQLRRARDINYLQEALRSQVAQRRNSDHSDSPLETLELRLGQEAVDRSVLWQKAPEILAVFHALQHTDGHHNFCNVEEKDQLAKWYLDFLEHCYDFELGIADATHLESDDNLMSQSTNLVSQSASAKITNDGSRKTLRRATTVIAHEMPKVRVNLANHNGEEVAVWHCPISGDLSHEHDGLDVSFRDALDTLLPEWTDAVRKAKGHDTPGEDTSTTSVTSSSTDTMEPESADVASTTRPLHRRLAHSVHSKTVGRVHDAWKSTRTHYREVMTAHHHIESQVKANIRIGEFLVPNEALPPDELPSKVTYYFSKSIGVWWLLTAGIHLLSCAFEIQRASNVVRRRGLWRKSRSLSATWPEPASFFQIASIHCNASVVVVNDRFSTYASHRLPNGTLGDLVKFTRPRMLSMVCDNQGCDALTQSRNRTSWLLSPLMHPVGSSRSKVVIPATHSWRKIAVAWASCWGSVCDSVRLAGWDGSEITIVDLKNTANGEEWAVQNSFVVRPGLGQCDGRSVACPTTMADYTNVRALQLGSQGLSLQVLLEDDSLDLWDLSIGAFLGRWRHNNHIAMCHDDRSFILARASKYGPVLETLSLPWQSIGIRKGSNGIAASV